MPVDPPTGYTDTSGQEPYNVALSLRRTACAYARPISEKKSGLRRKRETPPCLSPSVARVVVGRRPMMGAASLAAPATAGAIALISGHALHLVVRLVWKKCRVACLARLSCASEVFEARRNRDYQ